MKSKAKEKSYRVEYSSNNSGGEWWLKDKHWKALEEAGWKVLWVKDNSYYKGKERFLDALATNAVREGMHLREAVEEWEDVTGLSSTDVGCPCCGTPHHFTEYDENDKWIASGPEAHYSASW